MAEFFFIRPQGQPALRSRIRHLQRLGLTPSKSGESKRTKYTRHDIYDLAIALSLADLGVDPKEIVESSIPGLLAALDGAGKWMIEKYIVYKPQRFAGISATLSVESKKQVIKDLADKPRMAIINVADLVKRINESLA